MNTRALVLAVFAISGCFAQVAPDATSPAPVECAFPQGVCPEGNTYVEHVQFDDGHGCWVISAACYPAGTPVELVPDDCFTKVSLACEGSP